jgi:CheY-like chemotaxis protein
LRQILTNLVGNAIKFTEHGEVVVRTTLVEAHADTVLLRYAVTDTGIGIAPEVQARLFQAFSQADGSTTRTYGGTGLGLAISQRLVTMMGGTIGVESMPGQGSTFWFTLRLARRSSPPAATGAARSDPWDVRILCVDDHPTSRTIMEAQLNAWGMSASCVADGATALARLRAAQAEGQPYDLVIVDEQMPDMDGRQLAQAIKTDPAHAPIRIVLLSSLSQRRPGGAIQQAGIAAVLTKPVRQSQLYNCIMTVVGPVAEPTVNSPATQHQQHAQRQVHARVLVVEDNVINQKVAVRLLEKLGCRVDVAANGREAVNMHAQLVYDVILMDCQMPEMDGFAATVAIRQREASAGRHVPIIAMTANAMQGDRECCLAAGMDDYLAKPMQSAELYAAIAQFAPANVASPEDMPDPPMDLAAALMTADGDRSLLRELMEVLLAELPGQLATLRTALQDGDTPRLGLTAHSLKGALGTVGATRAQSLAQQLEVMARAGRIEEALPLWQQLDVEMTRLATFWTDANETERPPIVRI